MSASLSTDNAPFPDGRLQEPDRLDTPLDRICAPDSGPNPRHSTGEWRIAVLQHG